jgi:hypothetical protein
MPLVNFLGSSGLENTTFYDPTQPRLTQYKAMLENYCSQFADDPIPFLSFDEYPFQFDNVELVPAYQHYFTTLRGMRDVSIAHSTPFWSTIQVGRRLPRPSHPEDPVYPDPTPAQIAWQAYASIAYGAKGLSYWPVSPMIFQDDDSQERYEGGLVDATGAQTAKFCAIRDLTTDLHVLGPPRHTSRRTPYMPQAGARRRCQWRGRRTGPHR